ncbi:HpcH/HpaI aldolase family protein [Lapillicoccus jejuensis]|uniref:4-hydroxy-2-oxoheptanedioate aldolase n=1 Tax=Lapillicoccus jejuensis TaxID=402171 RepID=A0A542DXC1_9MICO|nr:aldolase/citrate lyase family protein [Lapillicoccus jejuensis]TQJ07742.1 4-hydroxy-2-oxoheptanedioate aldolase [Lapillicoccus jejuensis]
MPEPSYGAFCFGDSAVTAGDLLDGGLDWVCLDAQHGRWDDARVLGALDLLQDRAAQVLVRVRALDLGLVGRALDAGAGGVVVPLVEDAADAERAVQAVRYPPRGRRSMGPIRAAYGVLGDLAAADAGTLLAVMVETRGALDDVEAIAATDGVDVVFVGPFDLSLALGTDVASLLADDGPDGPLPRVVAACRAAGVRAGAYAGEPARAARLRELGFDWVAVTTDRAATAAGAAAALDALR